MKRILIIKTGAIGDVICTLPTITRIKSTYPDSEISWICGKTVAPILENIHEIDKLIIVNEKIIFSKNFVQIVKEFGLLYKKIFLRKYDIILNFHADIRYKVFDLFCISSKKRKFIRKVERPIPIPGRSRVFEHIRLFQQDDKSEMKDSLFPVFNFLPKINNEHFNSFTNETIVLAPGGANNPLRVEMLRRWPIENYRDLAEKLMSLGKKVVIVGGKTDKWIIPYFQNLDVKILIDEFNIPELIHCFSLSSVLITHDSGPFHLGVFAQSPYVIGLFGPTNPNEFLYGDLYDSKIIRLWKGCNLFCSPCYYGRKYSQSCKKNICMELITVDLILAELKRIQKI